MLGGRNSRVALVLIQSGISVPGEDTGAAEKAATLCTACDLPAKHLFVLPHSDVHLLGYTVRLVGVFIYTMERHSKLMSFFFLGIKEPHQWQQRFY